MMKWRKYIDEILKSPPVPQGHFQPTCCNTYLGEGDSVLFKGRATPFPKGKNNEIVKTQ